MELLGYISLVGMGLTLGMLGAGGSILTIPILVYFLKIPIMLATRYSLVIVGSTAFIAAVRYRNYIVFKKAIVFLIPSILGVFTARHFIISNLPNNIGNLSVEKLLLILLFIFIGLAGYFMIKPHMFYLKNHSSDYQIIKVSMVGFALGIVIGILGAGGGFLIIPALVLLMDFTMKEAIPTSLFIITTNSLIGFVADKNNFITDDWINLAKYLTPAFLGMFLGLYIAKFIKGEALKQNFGYFICFIGIAIFVKEFIL